MYGSSTLYTLATLRAHSPGEGVVVQVRLLHGTHGNVPSERDVLDIRYVSTVYKVYEHMLYVSSHLDVRIAQPHVLLAVLVNLCRPLSRIITGATTD
jgi:hypothetical protein